MKIGKCMLFKTQPRHRFKGVRNAVWKVFTYYEIGALFLKKNNTKNSQPASQPASHTGAGEGSVISRCLVYASAPWYPRILLFVCISFSKISKLPHFR